MIRQFAFLSGFIYLQAVFESEIYGSVFVNVWRLKQRHCVVCFFLYKNRQTIFRGREVEFKVYVR